MKKGAVTIGRYQSNRDEGGIFIEVIDESSGIHFLKIELSPHDLAMALTGMSMTPCTIELRGLTNVGKTREMKTEYLEVLVDQSRDAIIDQLREEARPYEVDGWMFSLNPQSRFDWDRDGNFAKIAVPFTRYVATS